MAKSTFEKIKNSKNKYCGYVNKFNAKGQAVAVCDEFIYNKKNRNNTASLLITRILIDIVNKYDGNVYANNSFILNEVNKYIDNDNKLNVNHLKKILSNLNNDNLIYSDYTRYIECDSGIKAYTGLLSGEHAFIQSKEYQDMILCAMENDNYDDFKLCLEFNNYDDFKMKNAFDYFKQNEVNLYNLNLIYNDNKFVYVNFDDLEYIKKFYEAFKFANKNKWISSNIYMYDDRTDRKDNYIYRHIYLNVDMLSKISAITDKKNEYYNNYLRINKKRRLMKIARTLQITLYKAIINLKNEGEYRRLTERKKEFQNKCKELLNKKNIEKMLVTIKEGRRPKTPIFVFESKNKAREKFKYLCNKFIRYIKNNEKENITEHTLQLIEDTILLHADYENSYVNNVGSLFEVVEDIINDINTTYITGQAINHNF